MSMQECLSCQDSIDTDISTVCQSCGVDSITRSSILIEAENLSNFLNINFDSALTIIENDKVGELIENMIACIVYKDGNINPFADQVELSKALLDNNIVENNIDTILINGIAYENYYDVKLTYTEDYIGDTKSDAWSYCVKCENSSIRFNNKEALTSFLSSGKIGDVTDIRVGDQCYKNYKLEVIFYEKLNIQSQKPILSYGEI